MRGGLYWPNVASEMVQARRWSRVWKKVAKNEKAANDMLVPGWRWQSKRIAELEDALRGVLEVVNYLPERDCECKRCAVAQRARELLGEAK